MMYAKQDNARKTGMNAQTSIDRVPESTGIVDYLTEKARIGLVLVMATSSVAGCQTTGGQTVQGYGIAGPGYTTSSPLYKPAGGYEPAGGSDGGSGGGGGSGGQ